MRIWESTHPIPHLDAVLWPTGAIENHGEHLPLGTDTLIASALAERVSLKLEKKGLRASVLPPLWFGYHWSTAHLRGTISVDPRTLIEYAYNVIVSVFNSLRPRAFVIINGHGGNEEPLEIALKEALKVVGPGFKGALISWWKYSDVIKEVFPDWEGGHADEVETSLMLAIEPALVKLERAKDIKGKKYKLRDLAKARELFSEGTVGKPSRARKELGETLLELLSQKISEEIASELRGPIEGVE